MTIAGSDPSGGAGLQADLKTFHQHGAYGAAVVTLITVQNTLGVSAVQTLDPALVSAQIDAVLDDLPVRAAKTGALGDARVVRAVAERLARRPSLALVVDPVMLSKNNNPLLDQDAVEVLIERLLPLATLVTPNAPEAAMLAGMSAVRDEADARIAIERIVARGARAVLVKGGHIDGARSVDFLFCDGAVHALDGPRVASPHTHGTGCTLSASITAHLASGRSLLESVTRAKAYVRRAIESGPGCDGHGIGPVDHFAAVD